MNRLTALRTWPAAAVLFLVLSSSTHLKADGFLDSLEARLEWLDYRMAVEQWSRYTTGSADSLQFYQDLYNYTLTDSAVLAYFSKPLPTGGDEEFARRRELLSSSVLGGRVETDPAVTHLRDSLSGIDINYRAEFEGEQTSSNELYRIYRLDDNRLRRESAYRAYCSVGNHMKDGLSRLIRLRNEKARHLGFKNYLEFVFKLTEIDIDEYRILLRRLDSLTQTPYQEILRKGRDRLRSSNLELWDLSYAYKDVNSEVDSYFPVDSQLGYIKASLKGMGFVIDKLPIYFDLDSREGKSQFAYAFTIKAPHDMRVLANLSHGYYSTRVLMHEIGHALHSAFFNQKRTLYANSIDGIWAEGMAQTLAGVMDDPIWLRQYSHMPDALIARHLQAQNDQAIIYLRTTLMRLNFEMQAYEDDQRDLNKLYWNLCERYLNLPSHEELAPWAAVIHFTTHPVYVQNYLYADVIAAQTLTYLYQHNEAVVDNQGTRSFLVQNYFRFGSRYEWPELLERGTGEVLNPDYLVRRLLVK